MSFRKHTHDEEPKLEAPPVSAPEPETPTAVAVADPPADAPMDNSITPTHPYVDPLSPVGEPVPLGTVGLGGFLPDPAPLAAVTVTGRARYNVIGKFRHQIYTVSGADGDTLDVGLNSIVKINADGPITGYTLTTLPSGRKRVAFASSAAFTNANVEIIGN